MTDPMSPAEMKGLLEGAATGPTSATFDHVLGRAQHARRTRWTLATAAVVVLVAAAVALPIALNGSNPPATKSIGHHHQIAIAPPDNANPGDVFKLVNRWVVHAPGADGVQLVLGDREDGGLVVFQSCGEMQGTWNADRNGDFVAYVFSGDEACFRHPALGVADPTDLPWLDQATSFTVTDHGVELNDGVGNVVARLTASRTLPPHSSTNTDSDRVAVLTATLRERLSPPAPLPSTLTPVTRSSVLGWWKPTDTSAPAAFLSFRSDRSAIGSDGCNGAGGRYQVGENGQLLTVAGGSTLVGCDISRTVDEFYEIGRAGLDANADLVLLDHAGKTIGTLTPVPTGQVVGTFESVGGPPGAPSELDPGTIQIHESGESTRISTFVTTMDGHFSVDLPAGSYSLIGNTPRFVIDGQQGDCRPGHLVRVTAGQTVTADVLCQRK